MDYHLRWPFATAVNYVEWGEDDLRCPHRFPRAVAGGWASGFIFAILHAISKLSFAGRSHPGYRPPGNGKRFREARDRAYRL